MARLTLNVPYSVKYRVREWMRRWPLVLRRTNQREVAQARQAGRAEVQDSLAEEREMLARVLGRLAQTEYRRVDRKYQMTVYFDPSMFSYGSVSQAEQRYIARHIASRVEAEIATSKFIKDASERDIREGPRHHTMGGSPHA